MSPAEILAAMVPGDPRREAAARELAGLLRGLCVRTIRAANGKCWRVDHAESSVCTPIISQEGCRQHLRVRLDSATTTEATWRVVFAR